MAGANRLPGLRCHDPSEGAVDIGLRLLVTIQSLHDPEESPHEKAWLHRIVCDVDLASAAYGRKHRGDAGAFFDEHVRRPDFTARLHSLAPAFGLHRMMNETRDAQADAISAGLDLDREATRMAVAAVEGALLRQLAVEPEGLELPAFRELLTKIALAPFASPRSLSETSVLIASDCHYDADSPTTHV